MGPGLDLRALVWMYLMHPGLDVMGPSLDVINGRWSGCNGP